MRVQCSPTKHRQAPPGDPEQAGLASMCVHLTFLLTFQPHNPSVQGIYSASASSSCRCLRTGASVLAAIIPLAAAAGTPMPGAHESPHLLRHAAFTHVVGACRLAANSKSPGYALIQLGPAA